MSDGRIIQRLESTKGLTINGLDSSSDGMTLSYTAAGSMWAIPATGGEPRKLAAGDSIVVDPNGLDLIVARQERDAVRLFRVPLCGAPEHEIPLPKELSVATALVANSVNKDGRILIDVDSHGSCWERPAILDPRTGKVDVVNVPYSGDIWVRRGRPSLASIARTCYSCPVIQPEDLVGSEWAEWYGLTPVERWRESEKLWQTYLALGGSLDPEPDTHSPFFDARAPRPRPAHGRTGVRVVRRGRV